MIIGIVSDTHEDKANALPHIMAELKVRGAEYIIHCGDIEPKHLDPKLFGGLPVICALIEEQVDRDEFRTPPAGWTFTTPGNRVHRIGDMLVYVGHKRSFDFLTGSEAELLATMDKIRRDNDSLRLMPSGHTHHQISCQTRLVNFVNPGAVELSFDGYEFALYDTGKNRTVFTRIPVTTPVIESFAVGVVSDSLNISDLDPAFWARLRQEFLELNVRHVIHCGNISVKDVGREELGEFEVYYNLRSDQRKSDAPKNWHLIEPANPVVEINEYRFFVQLDLGADLNEQSELDLHRVSLNLRRQYHDIRFILCGFTRPFLEEGEQVRIVNPGYAVRDRSFAVITLPRAEILFGQVPVDPLPLLESR